MLQTGFESLEDIGKKLLKTGPKTTKMWGKLIFTKPSVKGIDKIIVNISTFFMPMLLLLINSKR